MHIYLSPHHDDVCFSLAHLASRQGGNLVNIFSTSFYVARPMALPSGLKARTEVVSAIRRDEDSRFAAAAGLRRHDLGLGDAPVMGRGPFDLSNLGEEIGQVAAVLIPFVLDLLPPDSSTESASLYCPMGIGGHRNHRSTLFAVHGAREALGPRCTIFFYEDLHYASEIKARRAGIQLARELFAGCVLEPAVTPLDPNDAARKLELVTLYASQLSNSPNMASFIPASGMADGPHEIVWRVLQRAASQA